MRAAQAMRQREAFRWNIIAVLIFRKDGEAR
jgi:hypothetical protein